MELLLTSLIVAGIAVGQTSVAQAVPPLINYQGRLTDQSGLAMPPGAYIIQFRLWDSPTGGNLIWGQQQNLTIQSNGVFNVILGAPGGSSVPNAAPAVNSLAYAFTGSNCFLGVTVAAGVSGVIGNPIEILPRQQLLSVPFAIQAQTASSLVTNLAYALCPPGSIIAFGGVNIPPGWLLCDGTAVSSNQYPLLYAAIGTSWGIGETSSGGTHNFSLPDLRGLFLRGVNGTQTNFLYGSPNSLDANVLARTSGPSGGNSGNAVGSMEKDNMVSHTHNIDDHFTDNLNEFSYGRKYASDDNVAADTHPTSLAVLANDGSETCPKNAYVNYIIKY